MKSQIIISVLLLIKISSFLADDPKQGVRMTWIKNTNFDNPSNWVGFNGPCSKNIFTFPRELNPESQSDQKSAVISLPSEIRAKLIVLPNNGNFILQEGRTKFSDQSNNENCLGQEAVYSRIYKEDWHNPKNWKSDEGNSTMPHVEQVPCQFDSVIFPSNSSFNLKISQNIEVKEFYLGQKSLNYTSIALLMTSQLGSLQFNKKSEIHFKFSSNNCSKNATECLCQNYDPLIEKKICSLVKCESRKICPNPMKPKGFCCPICAFHLKINFNDGLNMQMIRNNLKEKIDLQKMGDNLDFYVGKYSNNSAQIIITPKSGLNYFEDMKFIMKEIHYNLAFEEKVITLIEMNSWEDYDSDGKLISNGMSGGIITLIIFFVLFIVCGLFALFIYLKQNGTSGLANLIPTSIPSIDVNLRIISDYFTRRVSQLSGGTTDDSRSFGFARFSNERISHLNIGQLSGVLNNPDDGQSQSGHQSQDLSGVAEEKIEIAKLPETIPGLGFSSESNVTYDLVASDEHPENQSQASNGEGVKETVLQTPTKKHFEE